MSRKVIIRVLALFFLPILLINYRLDATHIRAGEITVARISNSSLTYKIRITGYRDTGGVVAFGQGTLYLGDGTSLTNRDLGVSRIVAISNDTERVYKEVTHTYASVGFYTISYNEANRNAGVVNMKSSVTTPFHVETEIWIDSSIGLNHTPVFLVPPVDLGTVGAIFLHNPGAFDKDGDSLSYKMVTPKRDVGVLVDGYLSPIDASFYADFIHGNENKNGLPTFGIHQATGTLTWDAPGAKGEYNIAFVVKEWRFILGKWFNIGSVVRDMQIIIEDSDNQRPTLTIPPNLCVLAGTNILENISATDPDGDPVVLAAFGGPFQLETNPATFSSTTFGTATFTWKTNLFHIRKRPYAIQIKVTDRPNRGPRLVDFGTWQITVVAPAPTGVTVNIYNQNNMQLTWDKYSHVNAEKMQVWRRTGSLAFDAQDCTVGMPPEAGYELVATIDNKFTNSSNQEDYVSSYIDTANDLGLAAGSLHCYRLVALFAAPTGGESYASEEVCKERKLDQPIILKIDVEKTDEADGQINIEWIAPLEVNESQKPPYTYNVTRYETQSGLTNPIVIAERLKLLQFTDNNLNTIGKSYHYRIEASNANGVVGLSYPASSVWLEATSDISFITLRWSAVTPWSITSQRFPYHYIYRDQVEGHTNQGLVLIDSVKVDEVGHLYQDDGKFNGQTLSDKVKYTYYVSTQGSYANDKIKEPLINNSQKATAQPNDLIPPCTPVELTLADNFHCKQFLSNKSCAYNEFYNELTWDLNFAASCDNDVKHIEIHFSENGKVDDYLMVGTSNTSRFTHEDLDSFKGCYKIRAVDRSGNLSAFSNEICNDNCPNYILPNAFSPDENGINDVFMPLTDYIDDRLVVNWDNANCVRFVKQVKFKVFDRSGAMLFDYDSRTAKGENFHGIAIKWDGKTNHGRVLETGVYFYGADLTFDVLDESKQNATYKGWIQLIR